MSPNKRSLWTALMSLMLATLSFTTPIEAKAELPEWQSEGIALSFVPITIVNRRTTDDDGIVTSTPVYGLGLQAAYWLHPNVGVSAGYMLGLTPRESLEVDREIAHYFDLRFDGRLALGSRVALRASAGPALIRTKPPKEGPRVLRPVQMAMGVRFGLEAGGGPYSIRFEGDSWIAQARVDLAFRVAVDLRF